MMMTTTTKNGIIRNRHVQPSSLLRSSSGTRTVSTVLGNNNGFRFGNDASSPTNMTPVDMPFLSLKKDRENEERQLQHRTEQRRHYHATPQTDRAVAIMMGLGALSAVSYAGASAIQSYREWKASQPSAEELEKQQKEQASAAAEEQAKAKKTEEPKSTSSEKRTNIFKEWFDVGSKYYEGGFEDTMTRREAALILGVRESTSVQRIKDAHRKLLILNHPDTGGSTYISGKVNEAKELLLKNKM